MCVLGWGPICTLCCVASSHRNDPKCIWQQSNTHEAIYVYYLRASKNGAPMAQACRYQKHAYLQFSSSQSNTQFNALGILKIGSIPEMRTPCVVHYRSILVNGTEYLFWLSHALTPFTIDFPSHIEGSYMAITYFCNSVCEKPLQSNWKLVCR